MRYLEHGNGEEQGGIPSSIYLFGRKMLMVVSEHLWQRSY